MDVSDVILTPWKPAERCFFYITAALPCGSLQPDRKERIMFVIFVLFYVPLCLRFSVLGKPGLMEVKCYPCTNKERL